MIQAFGRLTYRLQREFDDDPKLDPQDLKIDLSGYYPEKVAQLAVLADGRNRKRGFHGEPFDEYNRFGQFLVRRKWDIVHLPEGGYDMQLTEDETPTRLKLFPKKGPWTRTVYRLSLSEDKRELTLHTASQSQVDIETGKQITEPVLIAPRNAEERLDMRIAVVTGIQMAIRQK